MKPTDDLGPGRALPLDEPGAVWVVESGSVELFAVRAEAEGAGAGRRYLCALGPGDALLAGGAFPAPSASGCRLVAETANGTRLSRTSEAALRAAGDHAKVRSCVERWIVALGSAVRTTASPDIQALSGAGTRSVGDQIGLRAPRGTVAWVRIREGRARWMDLADLPLDPASGIVPLAGGVWLTTEGPVEVETLPADGNADVGGLLAGAARFRQALLLHVGRVEERRSGEDFERFLKRKTLSRSMGEQALAELTALLDPADDGLSAPSEGRPILDAARVVGRSLGFDVRPAAGSEDSDRADTLEAIARASRVRVRRIALAGKWWRQDGGPLLGRMRQDARPVALIPTESGRYELFDPAGRRRTRVDAAVASGIEPEAYTFYRPFPDSLRRGTEVLRFALRGRGRDVMFVLAVGLAATALGMLTPQAMRVLIDRAIPDANGPMLSQLGLALAGAAVGLTLFKVAEGMALTRLTLGLTSPAQAAMWDRLLKLGPSFFRRFDTGDLLGRAGVVQAVSDRLGGGTLRAIFVGVLSSLNLALMAHYSASLAAVAACSAALVLAATAFQGVRIVRSLEPLQRVLGEAFGLVVQLIQGVSKLRVAAAEERAFASWARKFAHQQELLRGMYRLRDQLVVFNGLIPLLTTATVFWFATRSIGAPAEPGSRLTTGTFLAFNVAFGTFMGGITALSDTLIGAMQVATLWKRARPILDCEPEVSGDRFDPGRLEGKVALDRLTFRYRREGPPVLSDVTIRAEPGEFIGLVGPSGAGKSTLLRLLLGFESPESGSVHYDDRDLSRLDVHAVRRQIGVVLQSTRVMAGSVLETVAGGATVSLEEAWQAVRDAGLADDVLAMPMGMHTFISEGGTNVSGGQRQRLLIARAIVTRPRILLFDEATSALDNKTQAIVSESLERLQVTRVVIAHRLSTIRHADRIYVFDRGRVAEEGRFDDLARGGGLFARLMARQML